MVLKLKENFTEEQIETINKYERLRRKAWRKEKKVKEMQELESKLQALKRKIGD